MSAIPITRYRPGRASDGEGGFVDTYGEGYACFATLTMHQNQLRIVVDRCEDIRVGDVIVVADELDRNPAFYSVIGGAQAARGPLRSFDVERRDRPIWPLDANYLVLDGEFLLLDGQYLTVE